MCACCYTVAHSHSLGRARAFADDGKGDEVIESEESEYSDEEDDVQYTHELS